ncbi:hypothetical protein Tco_0736625 [Tanacetum coccineum]
MGCTSCGSMETFKLFVSQLCFEWFGGLFVQRVLQDHDCQRITGVIGTQKEKEKERKDDKKANGRLAINNGETLYMGNSATTDIKGEGDSDKFVLSKNQMYVGKGYAVNEVLPSLNIFLLTKEIGRSSKIDDEVVQDQRQRDDNDLQDERQDRPKEEEVEPRRSERARTEKSFRPDFVSFMVENEPTSYREVVTSLEWLNGKKPLKVK